MDSLERSGGGGLNVTFDVDARTGSRSADGTRSMLRSAAGRSPLDPEWLFGGVVGLVVVRVARPVRVSAAFAAADAARHEERVEREWGEGGVTFTYMTFDGQIPGPMVRTRVGDTVDLAIRNEESNSMAHSVDFHACRGTGGGAEATTVAPGETEHLRFQVTYPGAFV